MLSWAFFNPPNQFPTNRKASYESIKALGTNTEFKSYANMGHSVCDKELLDIANFVKKTLPPL